MFDFAGRSHQLFETPPRRPGPPVPPMESERCFELALAEWFVNKYWEPDDNRVLEIGAVTPYYRDCIAHTVIDIADTAPEALHVDVRDIKDFYGKDVLSISTLEHVEPVNSGIATLQRILRESRHCLVTVPVGYSPEFDEGLIHFGLHHLARLYWRRSLNEWVLLPPTVEYKGKYIHPKDRGTLLYAYATTVAVFYKGE